MSGVRTKERTRVVSDGNGHLPDCFFLFNNGEEDGPYSFRELDEMHRSGDLSSATPCRSRAGREWHDLAYILKNAAEQQAPDSEEMRIPKEAAPTPPKVEPMNKLVMDLVELSRRQNRSLVTIKWSLLVSIAILVGVGAVIALR